jgi:hypothetical protein
MCYLNAADVTAELRAYGKLSANSGVASTSTTTGAMVVAGGLGVTGRVTCADSVLSGQVTAGSAVLAPADQNWIFHAELTSVPTPTWLFAPVTTSSIGIVDYNPVLGVSIAAPNVSSYITWDDPGTACIPKLVNTGTIRFTYRPKYNGAPATSTRVLFDMADVNDLTSRVRIILTGGNITIRLMDTSDTTVAWTGVIDTDFVFELCFDLVGGTTHLFIDGVSVSTISKTGTRTPAYRFRLGNYVGSPSGTAAADCYFKDVCLSPNCVYTANHAVAAIPSTANVALTLNGPSVFPQEVYIPGTVNFGGDDKWEDLQLYASARGNGGSDPGWELYVAGGVYTWSFPTTDKSLYFVTQMPHSADCSDLRFHLHICPIGTVVAGLDRARFLLDVKIQKATGTAAVAIGSATPNDALTLAAGVPVSHIVSWPSLNLITSTGFSPNGSTLMFIKLTRDNTVTDPVSNYPDKLYLLGADIHYKIRSMGHAY